MADEDVIVVSEDGDIIQIIGGGDGSGGTDLHTAEALRLALAADPELLLFGDLTRNASGLVTAGGVIWPDGTTGEFTGTPSADFPDSLESYEITRGSATYTQPAMTRDETGAVIERPPIEVS